MVGVCKYIYETSGAKFETRSAYYFDMFFLILCPFAATLLIESMQGSNQKTSVFVGNSIRLLGGEKKKNHFRSIIL